MDKDTQENVADLVLTALLFTAKAHMWHFNTRSFSKHLAYEELYNGVREEIDTFAEAAMGCGVDLESGEDLQIQYVKEVDALDDIKSFVDYVNDVREDLQEEGFDALVSIIDDLVSLCLKVIYKLERLA
ncbi:hypothetical protein [Ralstonia phage RSP15]|uniref:starvation-inducible transcriptional regulator n=1 Tax=Ralstonia phage RSP15 TaxID=1785960 RepID=UPI00074D2ED7|nr:starvation-inducible transcriptional regulator [Ralstonia phage RSP15]BAU40048.1 hypothetical protein [Ralstonia phage RSP15]